VLLAVALAMVVGCTPSVRPRAVHRTRETAAALGQSDLPVLGGSRPVLGVDLYALSNYPAATVRTDGKRVLGYIKNVLKADAVGIVWNFYARSRHGDAVGAVRDTLSAHNVGILTRIAKRKGLLVEYRPLILVPSEPQNPWEGKIFPYQPAGWFSNYYHAELPYLKMAQRLGVREFVAGTELVDLNASPLWPKFFAEVSRVYHGLVSYSAWDGSYFGTSPEQPVLTARPELLPVKYLGMDMYWHMSQLPATASAAEVTAAWEGIFAKVAPSLLRRTAIDETGIQAREGAYSDPPDLGAAGTRSEQVQANWFTAACATVRQYHMRGVFFWKVDLTDYPAHPATSLSTFEGRKGAAAISECARILH
jgi:hypothetical protein